MAFWKKFWKKKNETKKGAEYEDHPLPSEVEGSSSADDPQLEQRIRARRNNLSVSRSGRFKAKGKERGQVNSNLFEQNTSPPPASKSVGGTCDSRDDSASDAAAVLGRAGDHVTAKGSFGKNSCREAQLALRTSGCSGGSVVTASAAAAGPLPTSIH